MTENNEIPEVIEEPTEAEILAAIEPETDEVVADDVVVDEPVLTDTLPEDESPEA